MHASSRLSQCRPCSIILNWPLQSTSRFCSLRATPHSRQQQRRGSDAAASAAATPPPQQPDRVEVRAASNSSSSSSSSTGSSSSTSSSADSFYSSSSFSSQARLPTAFKRHAITGDGSCMFRACVQGAHIAQHGSSLPSSQEYQQALQLRQAVVQALQDNREEMEPFLPGIAEDFEEYLQLMSKPGVWGGEPELLMASRVLKRPICVYQPAWNGPQHIVTYSEDLLKEAGAIHVLWSGNHYDLLLPQPASRL